MGNTAPITVAAHIEGWGTHTLDLVHDPRHQLATGFKITDEWADWSCWVALAHEIIRRDIQRKVEAEYDRA